MERPEFYFALPRLLAKWRGQSAARTEKNWLETNIAGTLSHLVVYVFAFQLLLAESAPWNQLLLCIPLALLVWIFWLLVFYFNSWLIELLRTCGLMRRLSDSRAQSVIIGLMTTAFAVYLLFAGPCAAMLGIIWLAAVSLNLVAAAVLALSDAGAK